MHRGGTAVSVALFLAGICGLIVAGERGAEPSAGRVVVSSSARLERRISCSFNESSLQDVLETLSALGGERVAVSPVAASSSIRITYEAKEERLVEVLDAVAACVGFSWVETRSGVLIGPDQELASAR